MSESETPETAADPEKTGRNPDGTFAKGNTVNLAGKPKGARHKTTLAAEALLDGEAEALTRKAVELALAGDVTALRLCLDRIVPARRDRYVTFDLPPLTTAADAVTAAAAVTTAVASGDLTPSEAAEIAKVVDMFTRALETHDHAERIAKLEAQR